MEDALRPRAACIVAAVLLLAPFALSAPTRPAAAVGAPAGGAAATPWTADSDFNGDDHDDLVAAVPDENHGKGIVQVLYGSRHGTQATRPDDQRWTEVNAGVGASKRRDIFGRAVARADFDGDGYSDLAASTLDRVAGQRFAGSVVILYGSPHGLTVRRNRVFTANTPGVKVRPHAGDGFGNALAAGDFNGDGRNDLAIGIDGNHQAAGEVEVLYGSPSGLQTNNPDDQRWTEASPGVGGQRRAWDEFGEALAAGDLNADGADDLAIGVPGADVGDAPTGGAVRILYGSPAGLQAAGSRYLTASTDGSGTVETTNEQLGSALAAGDFDGDGADDLAVGAPNRVGAPEKNFGAVDVLYGSASGIETTRTQVWAEGLNGLGGTPRSGDRFGVELATGDIGHGPQVDLAVGIPGAHGPRFPGSGAVAIIYGASGGLQAANAERWNESNDGTGDKQRWNDYFGIAIQVGQFGKGAKADLAIGSPGEPVKGLSHAGRIHVLYGSWRGVDPSKAQTWTQDSPGVKDRAEAYDEFSAGRSHWGL
jgi:hypothetical protein